MLWIELEILFAAKNFGPTRATCSVCKTSNVLQGRDIFDLCRKTITKQYGVYWNQTFVQMCSLHRLIGSPPFQCLVPEFWEGFFTWYEAGWRIFVGWYTQQITVITKRFDSVLISNVCSKNRAEGMCPSVPLSSFSCPLPYVCVWVYVCAEEERVCACPSVPLSSFYCHWSPLLCMCVRVFVCVSVRLSISYLYPAHPTLLVMCVHVCEKKTGRVCAVFVCPFLSSFSCPCGVYMFVARDYVWKKMWWWVGTAFTLEQT